MLSRSCALVPGPARGKSRRSTYATEDNCARTEAQSFDGAFRLVIDNECVLSEDQIKAKAGEILDARCQGSVSVHVWLDTLGASSYQIRRDTLPQRLFLGLPSCEINAPSACLDDATEHARFAFSNAGAQFLLSSNAKVQDHTLPVCIHNRNGTEISRTRLLNHVAQLFDPRIHINLPLFIASVSFAD